MLAQFDADGDAARTERIEVTSSRRRQSTMLAPQRIRALDGLRACAVILVFAYHLDESLLPGGFIGVDIFFVLSGYVIARHLLAEVNTERTLDLRAFWTRRIRRLVPPLVPVLAISAVLVAVMDPVHLRAFRADAVASMFSVSNWWFIFGERSYFDTTGRPPVLQHLWSLAVEEQFYLALPFALCIAAAVTRGWRVFVTRVAVTSLVLAGASMAVMGIGSAVDNVPYGSDGSVWYFGTVSHSFGLLLGVALAAWHARRGSTALPWSDRTVGVLGTIGIGALIGCAVLFSQADLGLYRWQLQAVSLIALVTIACAVACPGFDRVLGNRFPRWLGTRSYAIYLWHWPVLVFTAPGDVPVDGPLLMIARIALVLAAAELSYRYIEAPLRRDRATSRPPRHAMRVIALVLVGLVGIGVAAASTPQAAPSTSYREVGGPAHGRRDSAADSAGQTISAYGDSVLVGGWEGLEEHFPGLGGYAAEGLQADALFDHIARDRADGTLGDIVYIQTGNNGFIDPDAFAENIAELSDRTRVILAVPKVDRPWEKENIAILQDAATANSNVRLLDWRSEVTENPELLWDDGLHMKPDSAVVLAGLIDIAIDGD
jgi:peptidoglycan/LPS O-acetylase OafA/YrhL